MEKSGRKSLGCDSAGRRTRYICREERDVFLFHSDEFSGWVIPLDPEVVVSDDASRLPLASLAVGNRRALR